MKLAILPTSFLCAAVTLFSGCGGGADGSTPDGAVMSSVQALRQNDVAGFLNTILTEEKLEAARWEWKQKPAPTAQENAQFQQAMAKLTPSGAEDDMFKQIKPKLAEMRPQVAMMLGMIEGMGQAAIEKNEELTDTEKEQGGKALSDFVTLLRENDITSEDNARKVVGILCKTARKLKLDYLSELHQMEFDQALKKGDLVLAGLKQVMLVYGLDVDAFLDSFEATVLSENGNEAVVVLSYEFLGTRHTAQAEMERVDGRWFRKEADASASFNHSGIGN